jgi:hypothetical protein
MKSVSYFLHFASFVQLRDSVSGRILLAVAVLVLFEISSTTY